MNKYEHSLAKNQQISILLVPFMKKEPYYQFFLQLVMKKEFFLRAINLKVVMLLSFTMIMIIDQSQHQPTLFQM